MSRSATEPEPLMDITIYRDPSGEIVVCDEKVRAGFGNTLKEAFEDYENMYGNEYEVSD